MSWKRFVWVALLLAVASGTASSQASNPSQIVFAADRAPAVSGEIYRLDPNGHGVDLSKSPYQDTNPSVSPNGKRVAFISERSGKTRAYEVGINGRGLRQIAPLAAAGCTPVLAWQPSSTLLALGACRSSDVWIVQPNGKTIELRGVILFSQPQPWSPDGRVLAAYSQAKTGEPVPVALKAFSASGKRLFSVPNATTATWSSTGLLAVATRTAVEVFDESGHRRFTVQGRSSGPPAWSRNGQLLAVIVHHKLQVVTATGSRVLSKPFSGNNGLVWDGNHKVILGGLGSCYCEAKSVTVPTGSISRASNRWFDPLSSDERLAAVLSKSSAGYAVQVAPTTGGAGKTYSHVPQAYSDGPVPSVDSLQFVGSSRSLVYASFNPEPFTNLYSVAPNGGGVHMLPGVKPYASDPALSPDGETIAYSWAPYTGLTCKGCASQIRIASATGATGRTLTNPQDCTFDDWPTWSPDGNTILYSESQCDSAPELFTIPAGGGTPHDLGVAGSEPAWGPTRIAYLNGGLYTANPDGSDPMLVAHHGSNPAWSATGELAYLTGGSTLVVGSSSVKLPFKQVSSVAWSPDGTRLVITAAKAHAASLDVYSVKPDGTNLIRLTQNYDASGASWR